MEEALAVTLRLVGVLESLGVQYLVGGSVASSLYGERGRLRTSTSSPIYARRTSPGSLLPYATTSTSTNPQSATP